MKHSKNMFQNIIKLELLLSILMVIVLMCALSQINIVQEIIGLNFLF